MSNVVTRVWGFALVAVVALGMAGCGVKSAPAHPKGSNYPRQYPEPMPPVRVTAQPDKAKPETQPGYNPDSFYQYPNQPPAK